MTRSERYTAILGYFHENVGHTESELNWKNPFQLIVAVLLSAQCTDKRVNLTTPALFARYPNAEALAQADIDDVYQLIRSISYPNAKAQHLVEMAQHLVRDFGGEVPADNASLESLPGVGRKTANVVMAVAFGQPRVAVDTHVFRVANRLGLTRNSRTPLETEQVLNRYIPDEIKADAHHWLLLHGRYICVARKPKCDQCPLTSWCQSFHA